MQQQQQRQLPQNSPSRRPNSPLNLSPEDNALIINLTSRLMAQASDEQKNELRASLQARMEPKIFQKYISQGNDPLFLYYRNQALNRLRAEKQARLAQAQQLAISQQSRSQNMPDLAAPIKPQQLRDGEYGIQWGQQPPIFRPSSHLTPTSVRPDQHNYPANQSQYLDAMPEITATTAINNTRGALGNAIPQTSAYPAIDLAATRKRTWATSYGMEMDAGGYTEWSGKTVGFEGSNQRSSNRGPASQDLLDEEYAFFMSGMGTEIINRGNREDPGVWLHES
jgi:hypothetical protein